MAVGYNPKGGFELAAPSRHTLPVKTMITDGQTTFKSARGVHIRWAVIVAVLLLSALLAYRTPGGRLTYLLIILAPAMVTGLFILRRLPLGVMLVVAGGLLVPLNIGTGTETGLNPTILLLPAVTGLWVLDMALRRKAIRLHRHPAVALLLVLNAIVMLAFVVGQLPWFAIHGAGLNAQAGGLMVFFLSSAAFMVSAHALNERWLSRLVYLFIGIGALYVAARLLPPLGTMALRLFGNGATGSVFWIWLVALSAGLALFDHQLESRARLLLAAVAMATLFVAGFQSGNWASGWAPSILTLLILVTLRYPRWGWLFAFGAVFVFILEFDRFWSLVTDNQAWLARRQAWQIVLDTVRVNPLLGLGPSNYYFYVQRAAISGWGGMWNVTFSSHNNWIDLIAQTGIIGTGIFIFFTISMGRAGWRLYHRLPNGFPRAYAAACLAGLVATLVSGLLGDWFLPFVYNIGLAGMRSSILFWVFLGGLLALGQQHNNQKRGEI